MARSSDLVAELSSGFSAIPLSELQRMSGPLVRAADDREANLQHLDAVRLAGERLKRCGARSPRRSPVARPKESSHHACDVVIGMSAARAADGRPSGACRRARAFTLRAGPRIPRGQRRRPEAPRNNSAIRTVQSSMKRHFGRAVQRNRNQQYREVAPCRFLLNP